MTRTNSTTSQRHARPTAADLPPSAARGLIGRTARLSVGALTFLVTLKDYKFAYGNHRWLVAPISGSGETWTENISLL